MASAADKEARDWLVARSFNLRDLRKAVPLARKPGVTSTAMYEACWAGKLGVCKWLAAHGAAADVLTKNNRGATPMMAACREGQLHVLQWLAENGARDHLSSTSSIGLDHITISVTYGHLSVAKWLAEIGVVKSFRARNESGLSLLGLACMQGHLELAQWLYASLGPSADEDIRAPTANGFTPMLLACRGGHLSVAKWLYEMGAADDVRTKNASGHTPMYATCERGHLEVMKWLFNVGAAEDVHTKTTNKGFTPMLLACQMGHMHIVKWLGEVGATANARVLSNNGHSPMYAALQQSHLQIAEWLFECGGAAQDIFTKTANGVSPLDFAKHSKNVAVMQWLVLHGASNYLDHVDPFALQADFARDPLRLELHMSLKRLLVEHSTFMVALPKINSMFFGDAHHVSLGVAEKARVEGDLKTISIADFLGVPRGRSLRLLREASWYFSRMLNLPSKAQDHPAAMIASSNNGLLFFASRIMIEKIEPPNVQPTQMNAPQATFNRTPRASSAKDLGAQTKYAGVTKIMDPSKHASLSQASSLFGYQGFTTSNDEERRLTEIAVEKTAREKDAAVAEVTAAVEVAAAAEATRAIEVHNEAEEREKVEAAGYSEQMQADKADGQIGVSFKDDAGKQSATTSLGNFFGDNDGGLIGDAPAPSAIAEPKVKEPERYASIFCDEGVFFGDTAHVASHKTEHATPSPPVPQPPRNISSLAANIFGNDAFARAAPPLPPPPKGVGETLTTNIASLFGEDSKGGNIVASEAAEAEKAAEVATSQAEANAASRQAERQAETDAAQVRSGLEKNGETERLRESAVKAKQAEEERLCAAAKLEPQKDKQVAGDQKYARVASNSITQAHNADRDGGTSDGAYTDIDADNHDETATGKSINASAVCHINEVGIIVAPIVVTEDAKAEAEETVRVRAEIYEVMAKAVAEYAAEEKTKAGVKAAEFKAKAPPKPAMSWGGLFDDDDDDDDDTAVDVSKKVTEEEAVDAARVRIAEENEAASQQQAMEATAVAAAAVASASAEEARRQTEADAARLQAEREKKAEGERLREAVVKAKGNAEFADEVETKKYAEVASTPTDGACNTSDGDNTDIDAVDSPDDNASEKTPITSAVRQIDEVDRSSAALIGVTEAASAKSEEAVIVRAEMRGVMARAPAEHAAEEMNRADAKAAELSSKVAPKPASSWGGLFDDDDNEADALKELAEKEAEDAARMQVAQENETARQKQSTEATTAATVAHTFSSAAAEEERRQAEADAAQLRAKVEKQAENERQREAAMAAAASAEGAKRKSEREVEKRMREAAVAAEQACLEDEGKKAGASIAHGLAKDSSEVKQDARFHAANEGVVRVRAEMEEVMARAAAEHAAVEKAKADKAAALKAKAKVPPKAAWGGLFDDDFSDEER